MRKTILTALCIILAGISFTGCTLGSSNAIESQQTEKMTREAAISVGMPGITKFAEKRALKQIYELRDNTIATETFIVDMHGKLHHFCNSLGYGIPYSTQYVNPEVYEAFHGSILPQPEPNGLFMPTSSSATWITCVDKNSLPKTVYVEPQIIVSPMELKE